MPDDPNRRLDETEVATALGISVDSLNRLIETKEFPDRIWMTERTGHWVYEDIRCYLYLRARIGPKKFPIPVPRSRGAGGGQEGGTEGEQRK